MDRQSESLTSAEETPAVAIATVGARFARLAAEAIALLLVAGLALEVPLRLLGMQPQRVVPSATVPDPWTEWAMTPGVRENEWTVTNDKGLHEDRPVTVAKPAGRRRVAMMGSSVTWGLGEWLRNTIPRAAEEGLRASGCPADVLNFAGIGYALSNASAQLQSTVHQFDPDVVVMVMDLGLARARYPSPAPPRKASVAVRQLGFFEGAFMKATEFSVVLTLLDDPSRARWAFPNWLPAAEARPSTQAARGITSASYGLAPLQRAWGSLLEGLERLVARLKAPETGSIPARVLHAREPPAPPWAIASYEARRRKEIASSIAADAAFAREMGFALYFVTPYVPYFDATEKQIAGFSLNMLERSESLYGGLGPAARRETELVSEVVREAAPREGARVIDMLAASRAARMASGDFTTDGIHMSAQGNHHLGQIVAQRLLADGLCGPRHP